MIKPWIAVAALVAATTTLRASEPFTPTDKTNVIAFSAGNETGDIEYRHTFLNSRLALLALAGYHASSYHSNDPDVPDSSSHASELGIGLRNNFDMRERLRPFAQVEVIRTSATNYYVQCHASPSFNYIASGGGEYFLANRVSLEGSAGVAFFRSSQNCTYGDPPLAFKQQNRSFGTFRTLLSINFYF